MQTVTLKLAATHIDGSPATGKVSLSYDGGVVITDQRVAVYPVRIVQEINAQEVSINDEPVNVGYAEFTVPASNADLPGAGGTYTAIVDLETGDRYTTTFFADKDAPDGIIWISRLQSTDPDPGTQVTVVTYEEVREWVAEATQGMVTGGKITGNNLVLTRADGSEASAGNVRGPKGDTGPAGSQVPMRVDTSAGTRVYATIGGTEHLLSAETGARDITSLLTAPAEPGGTPRWTAQRILLDRHGNTVTLRVTLLNGPAGDPFITLPAGYRTRDWSEFYASNAGSMMSRGSGGATAGSFYLTGEARRALFTATWTTDDPWPTTLPGTPA
ncbi:hypothetical protein ODZ83_10785 [Acaricomes phytoseiuli]|uniref:hypothetical protein n=1 Tax=Acaricomes phytoseiuli TaxID=291968 RepID=UPI0022216629|nr:hypothetical protein [Acaricomes phytoseiuli]MCW1250648.1 hypothetical protein [Acaricomes phytoseiuli]